MKVTRVIGSMAAALAVLLPTALGFADVQIISASVCRPVGLPPTTTEYFGQGEMFNTSATDRLGVTCPLTNTDGATSGTHAVRIDVVAWDLNKDAAEYITCQLYHSTSLTGAISWDATVYSSPATANTHSNFDIQMYNTSTSTYPTIYAGGVFGIYCELPPLDDDSQAASYLSHIKVDW